MNLRKFRVIMGVTLRNCETELECIQELDELKLDGSNGIGVAVQVASILLFSCSGWTQQHFSWFPTLC